MAHYIASYKTGYTLANGRERIGLQFGRMGTARQPAARLFSFVPSLMNYKAPSIRDGCAILRGDAIETAMAEFNAALYARRTADNARAIVCAVNRSRSAELRARDWSDKARDVLAFHSFALCLDRDGDEKTRAALIIIPRYRRNYERHALPFDARAAWYGAYSDARYSIKRRARNVAAQFGCGFGV
ncbi:hypothetical protein AH2_0005 [Burkholderia phage vB_BceS_AH2]|uniref:Uncharacterized protein n=1 Tax=Burkholderia phage vB_BceS_AH2 TaxID=1133022 RepID=I6NSQ8_9CAUD|nr:hypothetical protein B613_gp05 [Burkholderia phage vB_BceS_AH2]AEY69516.1 hypothetical protein AH2_0005 [Burkholderia phage vB_BceS_AH2]